MDFQTCPICQIRVMPIQGKCPSCQKMLAEKPPLGREPSPFADEFAPRGYHSTAADSTNPYLAPRFVSHEPETYRRRTNNDLVSTLFSFEGRVPRRVYWAVSLLMTFSMYALFLVLFLIFGNQDEIIVAAILIVAIPYTWISLAVTVKRWHDRDKSGWWILIGLIPYVGPLWAFIENGCLRGTIGPNQYGDDPT